MYSREEQRNRQVRKYKNQILSNVGTARLPKLEDHHSQLSNIFSQEEFGWWSEAVKQVLDMGNELSAEPRQRANVFAQQIRDRNASRNLMPPSQVQSLSQSQLVSYMQPQTVGLIQQPQTVGLIQQPQIVQPQTLPQITYVQQSARSQQPPQIQGGGQQFPDQNNTSSILLAEIHKLEKASLRVIQCCSGINDTVLKIEKYVTCQVMPALCTLDQLVIDNQEEREANTRANQQIISKIEALTNMIQDMNPPNDQINAQIAAVEQNNLMVAVENNDPSVALGQSIGDGSDYAGVS